MKDPAFLFYSESFYTGTRMMYPEERACYIDLMIYQHQYGVIPDDIKKLKLFCSGCSEETILNVLNQKFNHMVNGWSNQRLTDEIEKRNKYKPKKIASASLAGLISSNKLSVSDAKYIKDSFKIDDFINEKDEDAIKKMVNQWFNQMVNYLRNRNRDINKIRNIDKDIIKDKDENINLEEKLIIEQFNNICTSLPKIRSLTKKRKEKLKLRLKEFKESNVDVSELFKIVEESDFLTGREGKWSCSFDWIFNNQENWIKIWEGNYNNKQPKQTEFKRIGSYGEEF